MARLRALKSKSTLTTRSSLFSTKSIGPILTESYGEQLVAILLEFTTSICFVLSQPETFYITINGEKFRYTPDFYFERTTGEQVYIEVKDERYLRKPEMSDRLEKAKAYFEKEGMELKIITDQQLRDKTMHLNNIRHLMRYRSRAYNQLVPLTAQVPQPLPRTLGELKAVVGAENAYRFIANETIWCDLGERLTDDTIITDMGDNEHEYID